MQHDQVVDQKRVADVASIITQMADRAPPGRKSAMTLKHWLAAVKSLDPVATKDEVYEALGVLCKGGEMRHNPYAEVRAQDGTLLATGGFYRPAEPEPHPDADYQAAID